jgi:hypothetical protein
LLELGDQAGQGLRLLVGSEVTARQTHNPQAEPAQPLFRKVHLAVFKPIFVAAANNKRELSTIGLEEVAEIDAVTLRLVIGGEARRSREIKSAIVAAYGVV